MPKYFIKDIDLKIIRYLYNLKKNKEITTYSLAKKIFDNNKNLDKNRFYSDKQKYIDYRMKKLNEVGIIYISKNGRNNVFTLILDNVYFKKIKNKNLGIDTDATFLKIDKNWNIFNSQFSENPFRKKFI